MGDEFTQERPPIGTKMVRHMTNGRIVKIDFGTCENHAKMPRGWTFEPTGKHAQLYERPPEERNACPMLVDGVVERIVTPDWLAVSQVPTSDHYVRKQFPKMVVHNGLSFKRRKGDEVCWFDYYDETKQYIERVNSND